MLSEKEKNQLKVDKTRYEKLKSLLRSDGWPEVQKIFDEIYAESMDLLISGKTVEERESARGCLLALKKITDALDSEWRYLENANDKFIGNLPKKP